MPGRVKTRLHVSYSPQEAALLAGAALQDTLRTARSCAPVHLVLDGDPDLLEMDLDGVEVHQQCAGPLGHRLEHAYSVAGGGVLVGMDTPQVSRMQLLSALHEFISGRTPFGTCEDGGWWLLGLTGLEAHLVRDVPSSLAVTGALQEEKLRAAGCFVSLQDVLVDVDTPEDASLVARMVPDSLFATCLGELIVAPGGTS